MPQRPGFRSAKRHRGVCVCTGVTADFVPGALVAIGSFLKAHPHFEGDVVVFHDGLPNKQRNVLRDACKRLRFELVSPALRQRCQALEDAFPHWRDRLPRFFTLEAFRLAGYRKVLYCDADLLFQGHVDALLDAPATLACCGDRAYIAGERRDAATYLALPRDEEHDEARDEARNDERRPAKIIEQPFNSGLLAIDGALPGPRCHGELVELVAPATWCGVRDVLMDQLVLNRYFSGRQTMFDSSHNYLLGSAEALRTRHGLAMDAARVLHFNVPCKPWMIDAWLPWGLDDPRHGLRLMPAFERWLAMYRECAKGALLRAAHRLYKANAMERERHGA